MNKVIISTDSCADEFKSIFKEKEIRYMPMIYILDKEYKDTFDSQKEYDLFYTNMKEGAMPTTSMLNAYEMEEYFENIIKETNSDIVHIALSSGLSGTYDNTLKGANAVMERYPNNKVYVVDSLSATQGQNFLVNMAVAEKNKGTTAKTIFNILQETKHNLQHWFYIKDLFHLKRGGRISGAKAVIGTVLQTKPILTINTEGKLAINSKAMGTKKAVKLLSDKLETMQLENKEQDVVIANANAPEEAELLKKFVLNRFNKVNVIIKNIGPVIGAHTGPGTVGIIFMGAPRLNIKSDS